MLTSVFVLPLFQLRNPTNSLLYSLQNKLICKFWMCMLNQIRKLHLKIGGLFFFYRKERVRKNVSEITFLSLSYLFRLVCNVFDNYYLNCWKLSLYFYQFTCKVICINKPLMLSQKSVRKKKKDILKFGVQPYYHSHFGKFCAWSLFLVFFCLPWLVFFCQPYLFWRNFMVSQLSKTTDATTYLQVACLLHFNLCA